MGLVITKRVMTEKAVDVKIPKITIIGDYSPSICLIDGRVVQYNCSHIQCEECYFGISVIEALANVPNK